MPISSSQNCREGRIFFGKRGAGFTLIEILVVLLIVTILVGITVPRLPGFADSADYDLEARRLELLLNMARNEAVLDSIEFGFGPTDEGYTFYRYNDGSQTWQRGESPFQSRKLPEQLTLRIKADSSEFSLEGENVPPVLILSSGETTPAEITLRSSKDFEKILETDGYSRFEWQEDD